MKNYPGTFNKPAVRHEILAGATILFGLYLISLHHVALFHSLAELGNIVIAFSIFTLAWHSRHFVHNQYLVFVGVALLFVGSLNAIHLLAFLGMQDFAQDNGRLPLNLWLAARYLQALSLLIAPWSIGKRINWYVMFGVYSLLVVLTLISLLVWQLFPATSLAGIGLALFQQASGYVIVFVMLVAIVFLLRKRQGFEPDILALLVLAMVLGVAAEILFSLYDRIYDNVAIAGHIFRMISFYLLYRAIVATGLMQPYRLLFRDLIQTQARLSKANDELERKVEERTETLNYINEQLRQEIAERLQAEQALVKERTMLRNLIDSLPDYIFVKDTESRFVLNNPTHLRALGATTQADVVGKTDLDIFPRDLAEQYYADERELLHTGRPLINREERVIDATGRHFWVLVTKVPLFDSQGQVTGLVGISRDISERKQIEEALQVSEEKFRQLAEHIDSIFWMMSLDRRQLFYVNPAYEQIFGRSCDSLYQDPRSWLAAVYDEDRLQVQAALEQHNQGKGFGWLEYRVVRPDGETRWVRDRTIPIYDDTGQIYRVAGITVDMTQRKRAEKALEQRNRELALLNRASQAFNSSLDLDKVLSSVLEEVRRLLNVPGAFWLIDPQRGDLVCQQASGPYSEAVRGWRIALGEGIVGWVAQSGQSVIVPDTRLDRRHFGGVDQETGLETRSVLSVPLRVKHAVIGVLQLLDTVANRFDPADLALIESLAATAAIAIENARLYEQTLQDAETRATLLEEVNHRVKNNLATIGGLLHLAQRHAKQEDQLAYQVVTAGLVNRIQGLATVHRLLSATEWAPVLLTVLLSQVVYSARQILPPDKQLSVDIVPTSIRIIPKQASSLALVITELATNTIQHALADRQAACITAHTLLEEGGMVLLEFRDDGPGYPDDVIAGERHHVGLYLLRSLVHTDLQGTITLHNDQGAVATIRFKNKVGI